MIPMKAFLFKSVASATSASGYQFVKIKSVRDYEQKFV